MVGSSKYKSQTNNPRGAKRRGGLWYHATMTTATLLKHKKVATKARGTVTLSVKTYRQLLDAAIPTYYLTGKEATALDKLVKEGLREHAEGKTRTIRSLADLD